MWRAARCRLMAPRIRLNGNLEYEVREAGVHATHTALNLAGAWGTTAAANDLAVLDILITALRLELELWAAGLDDSNRVQYLNWYDQHPDQYCRIAAYLSGRRPGFVRDPGQRHAGRLHLETFGTGSEWAFLFAVRTRHPIPGHCGRSPGLRRASRFPGWTTQPSKSGFPVPVASTTWCQRPDSARQRSMAASPLSGSVPMTVNGSGSPYKLTTGATGGLGTTPTPEVPVNCCQSLAPVAFTVRNRNLYMIRLGSPVMVVESKRWGNV